MAETLIASGQSNQNDGSIQVVTVEDILCSLVISKNEFEDDLPIIPTGSNVEHEKVLYRLSLKAKLTERGIGKPISGRGLELKSNRQNDTIRQNNKSDANGEIVVTLETRDSGKLTLSSSSKGVTMAETKLSLQEAWYQSKFLITGYNICAEEDFSGDLVDANGLKEKHKEDFLFGARGVPMQGTGQADDGQYIKLQSMGGGWHHNARGAPDHVNDQKKLGFYYTKTLPCAYGFLKEERTIAVDPTVIPKKFRVNIDGVGERHGEDTGSAIRGYHIDNFLGSGQAVVTAWLHGGVNGTKRKVKYLGK